MKDENTSLYKKYERYKTSGSGSRKLRERCGYVVNAKSMLGVFSLPRFDQIEINVDETDFEHMKQKLQKYDLIQK